MPQYLVANYLPDDFDPSTVTEAMIEEIHALNREMIAAGVRKFAAGFPRPPMPRRCGSSPTARCLSSTGRTPRPRSTWAVFGYWKPPIWTRHSRGSARVPSPAMRWARCANFYSSRLRSERRNNLAAWCPRFTSFSWTLTWERRDEPLLPRQPNRRANPSTGLRAGCGARLFVSPVDF
jgi:hypothetical protein